MLLKYIWISLLYMFAHSSEDGKIDEAEEARSGDEEVVEPEEEPEGIVNRKIFNHVCK